MDQLINSFHTLGYWGYVILFVIIFFESFPLTLFLPGDSLLFTTGFLTSQGVFNIWILLPVLFVGSILGYMFSYAMGERVRDFILRSNDRYWFKKKHIDYTEGFYNRYGAKTLVIGRFVPIVRSFAPMLAGAVKMDYKEFSKYMFIGGLLWSVGVTLAGYYLGTLIPNVDLYLTPIVIAIIFVSLIPVIIEFVRGQIEKRKKKQLNGTNN